MVKKKIQPTEPDPAKIGQKLKPPRWYKGEQFEYHENLLNKGKITGYFKIAAGRYGGKRVIFRYYKCYENGIMIYVDNTMMKRGVTQSLSTPHLFHSSNKKEYDRELKLFEALLK